MFDSGLIAIVGEQGSGKTLTMTYFGYLAFKKGFQIYTNYKINFKHVYIDKLEDIEKIKSGIALMDELWTWLDARAPASKRNMYATQIFAKTRKRGNVWYYTMQVSNMIDRRVRQYSDILVFPEVYLDKNNIPYKVRLELYDKFYNRTAIEFNPKPILNMYDTKEEVAEMDYMETLERIANKLKNDVIFLKLHTKGAKENYIAKQYKISKEDAKVILELF